LDLLALALSGKKAAGQGTFEKVIKMIDNMVEVLKKEQVDDDDKKEYCGIQLDSADDKKKGLERTLTEAENAIETSTEAIATLTEEIAAANSQIAETETAILKASQVREGENAEFQTVVADQRATQDILTKALGKLKAFYKKAKGGALMQKASQEPPVKFNAYKKNSGASPVIGMIEQIIEDSKALEAEAVAGEKEAQATYETFVKDSNDLIKNFLITLRRRPRHPPKQRKTWYKPRATWIAQWACLNLWR